MMYISKNKSFKLCNNVLVVGSILSVVLFSACNPYSRDDLLFAMVSPAASELRLAPVGVFSRSDAELAGGTSQLSQAMQQGCAATNLRCHAIRVADGFNELTTSLLKLVDNTLQTPANFRSHIEGYSRRVWGPFVVDQMTLRVEMVRTPENLYAICMHVAMGALEKMPTPEELNCDRSPAEFGLQTLLEGVFEPGSIENARAQNGSGALLFHASALAESAPELALLGEVAFSYDNTGTQRKIGVTVRGANDEGSAIDSDYFFLQEKETRAGRFYYALRQDFTPGVFGTGFQREELISVAQWDASFAGRVDAVVRGGDLGDFQYNAVHCWDEAFMTNFFFDDDDAHPNVGEIAACVFGEPPPIPEDDPLFSLDD